MIKVFLVDDHQLMIDGVKSILQQDDFIKVIGEASNGQEALDKIENNVPDVILLDIRMPIMDGIETSKIIVEKYPAVKIIIVSMHNKKDYIIHLMQIGISGYILKDKSKEHLINAIHHVFKGTPYFGLDVLTVASSRVENLEPKEPLTKREIEILCKIAEGHTTKEIAEQLNIGSTTVNTYRRNLLIKLNMANDKHLVRYAIKHGYVKL